MGEQIWPATEPATFKNPHDITMCDSVAGPRYQINGAKNTYNASEFDIEIILTRKPPVLQIGDLVTHVDYDFTWKVLGTYEDRVWLMCLGASGGTISGTTPRTYYLADVRLAQ